MPFWRRKPLHEQLAEEGGLVDPMPRRLPWDQVGVHGVPRPRRWDSVVTVEAPGIDGDERDFVLLADGTLIGEDADKPLAEAVDLDPPFRAQAVRRGDDLWAVAANRITVVELDVDPGGDAVTSSFATASARCWSTARARSAASRSSKSCSAATARFTPSASTSSSGK